MNMPSIFKRDNAHLSVESHEESMRRNRLETGPSAAPAVQSGIGDQLSSHGELYLTELISIVSESRWLILKIILAALLIGISHAYLMTPIYKTDALLQIEKDSLGIINLEDFRGFSELFDSSTITSEIQIANSRSVLAPVVEERRLDIITRPVYLPIVGEWIVNLYERFFKEDGLIEPWFGLSRYAWGGEELEITAFNVPRDYFWKPFYLKIISDEQLELLDEDKKMLGRVTIGEPAVIPLSEEVNVNLTVANFKARTGTSFEINKISLLAAIENLKSNMEITDVAGDGDSPFSSSSGLILISLWGSDRVGISDIANDIVSKYTDNNIRLNSTKAATTYQFLSEQLENVKQRLETAEDAYNNYRQKKGSVDLTLETESVLQEIVATEASISKLKQSRVELLQRFTPTHPKVATLDSQLAVETRRLESYEDRVKNLPDTQQKALRLSREVEVNSKLYTLLLDKVNELDVVRAGTVGNVNIIDRAEVPYEPVKPRKSFVIAVYLVLGGFLGIGLAILRDRLIGGVKDPNVIEKEIGLPVYAMVPQSKAQSSMKGDESKIKNRTSPAVLAIQNPSDPAIESLRSLRTSMHFALLEARNNIVAFTSPGPSDGKSFVSINYGVVLANAGKRVLVVDCDMRKGKLHQVFGIKRSMGLADAIAADIPVDDVIHNTQIENLYILTTGTLPPNPSELLLHENFVSVLERISNTFDYVIIDTPPVLAVTDSATVGGMAGATFLVVRSGLHPVREIDQCVKRLAQARTNLRGILLNNIQAVSHSYGYGRFYGYNYNYSSSKAKH